MMSMSKRLRALTWLTWIVAFTVAATGLATPVGAQQGSPAGATEGADAGPIPSGNASGGDPLATVAFVSGQVGVWREGGDSWTMVQGPHSLYMGDHVRTGMDSRAVLAFTDGSEVMMHEQTTLQIAPRSPVDEPKGVAARIKVSLGQIFNRVTPGQSDLEFETPDAVAAIRGTDFFVRTGESLIADLLQGLILGFGPAAAPLTFEQIETLAAQPGEDLFTFLLVLTGRVEVSNLLGSVLVSAGQRTEARADRAPAEPTDATPEEMDDATGWVDELDEERGVTGEEPGEGDDEPGDESQDADADEPVDADPGEPTEGPLGPDPAGVFVPAGDAAPEADDGDDPGDPGDGEDPEDPEDPGDGGADASVALGSFLEPAELYADDELEEIWFGVNLTNTGDTDIEDLSLRVTLPPSVLPSDGSLFMFDPATETNPSDLGWDWEQSSDGVTVFVDAAAEWAPLPPGATRHIEFAFDVTDLKGLPGEYAVTAAVYEGGLEEPLAEDMTVFTILESELVTSVEVEASLDSSQVEIGSSVTYEAHVQNAGNTDINWLKVRISMPPVMTVDLERFESFVLAWGDAMSGGAEMEVSTDSDGHHVDVVFEGSPGNEPGQTRGLRFPIEVGEVEGDYEIATAVYLDPLGDASVTTEPLSLSVVSPSDTHSSIAGRITRGDDPVASHRVGLWSISVGGEPGAGGGGSDLVWEETDEDGYYEFRVEPGEYALLVGTAAEEFGSPEFEPGGVIGDVLAWVRTVAVDEDLTDVHFDLAVGQGITFDLSTEYSIWGAGGEEEGGPLTRTYVGGQSADDVFLLRADDLHWSSLSLTLAESVDSNLLFGLGDGQWGLELVPEGSTGFDVPLEMDEELHAFIHEWPGDDGEVFRLVLSVQSSDYGFLSILGPALVSRDTPFAEELDRIHFVHGHGDDLQFTLYGHDLDLVTGVVLWVDGGQSWIDIEPESAGVIPSADGGSATVNIPWNEVAVADDPSIGWHDISLVAGPSNGVFSQGSLRLLVTSSDLSGNAPGVVLERGDLGRSGTGRGPEEGTASFVVQPWPSGQTSGLWERLDGPPQFVGSHVLVGGQQDNVGKQLQVFSKDGEENGTFSVATSAVTGAIGTHPNAAYALFVEDGGSGASHLAATPLPGSEPLHLADTSFESPDALLVHDGIVVTFHSDFPRLTVRTFDAGGFRPAMSMAEIDAGDSTNYRLAVAAPFGQDPRIIAAVGDVLWGADLYSLGGLQQPWLYQFSGEIVDMVLSHDDRVAYVVTYGDLGSPVVTAISIEDGSLMWDSMIDLGGSGGSDVVGGLVPDGLAVNPETGELYLLTWRGTQGDLPQIEAVAHVLDPHEDWVVGSAHTIIVPSDEDSVPLGGLFFDPATGYLYGFITPADSNREPTHETRLFRLDATAMASPGAPPPQTLLGPADGYRVQSMALAHGYVWIVSMDQESSAEGSYGLYLVGPEQTEAFYVDPPLVKRADKAMAQIGDIVTYTIAFENTEAPDDQSPVVPQGNVWIQDVLPPGFIFVEGSAFLHPNGVGGAAPVALDPAPSSSGRTLQFMLANPSANPGDADDVIAPDAMRSLTYQVIVGPRVIEGATYTNEAVGYADGANTTPGWLDSDNVCPDAAGAGPDCDFILTNVARADVHIAPGVFAPRATVVGKVFHDIDGDGAQGPAEPGIPGARIVMETGVSVVTDGFGKFSLSNLTPGLHVFMLDESSLSLPDGSGGTSGSPETLRVSSGGPFRLLDLTGGGLFTVNFPVEK